MRGLPIDVALTRFRDLKQLAVEINGHAELIPLKANQAVTLANDACQEMILCGQALIRAKDLIHHGDWLGWLEENCTVSHATATRYMRAARSQINAPNIRKLYLAADILKEPDRNGSSPAEPAEITAGRVTKWVATLRVKIELQIEQWDEDERREVAISLEPLHELYLSLTDSQDGDSNLNRR